MEGNDLAPYAPIQQATLFEGVLASKPVGLRKVRYRLSSRSNDWASVIKQMTPNDLPIKSLVDCVNRRGIGTVVYTFLPPDAVDEIDRWLLRKGVSTIVESYPDVEALAYDLRFNRSVHVIYVETQEQQSIIGIRATVVGSERSW